MVATVTNIGSASATVHYFEQAGYYAKGDPEHRKASFWHGEAARALGLGRHVSPKRFNAILEGHVPGTGLRLGRVRDGEHQHRPGGGPHTAGPEVGVAAGAYVYVDRGQDDWFRRLWPWRHHVWSQHGRTLLFCMNEARKADETVACRFHVERYGPDCPKPEDQGIAVGTMFSCPPWERGPTDPAPRWDDGASQ